MAGVSVSLRIGPGLHSKTHGETDRQRKREREQEREEPTVMQACDPQHLDGVRGGQEFKGSLGYTASFRPAQAT